MLRSRFLTCLIALSVTTAASVGVAAGASAVPVIEDPHISVPAGSAAGPSVVNSVGDTFVLDTANKKVLRFAVGNPTPFEYNLEMGATPVNLGIDGADNVYVENAGAIAQITRGGTFTKSWRAMPTGYIAGKIDVRSDGIVYVVATGTNALVVFNQADMTPAVTPVLGAPTDVGSDARGDVYVATKRGYITRINSGGVDDSYIALESNDPIDLAVRPDGSLVVLDGTTGKLSEYAATPAMPAVSAALPGVKEVTLDSKGTIYFAAMGTNAIQSAAHADSTPRTVAPVARAVAADAISMTSDQRLLLSYARAGVVVEVPLLPQITSPTISATGAVGTPLSIVIATSGLDDISISTGTLPTWLSLDPTTNTLSGTPTDAGTFTFEYSASNALGDSDVLTATITISAGPMPTPTPSPGSGGSGAGGNAGAGQGGSNGTASGSGRGTLASTGSEAGLLAAAALALLGLGAGGAVVNRRRQRA